MKKCDFTPNKIQNMVENRHEKNVFHQNDTKRKKNESWHSKTS